MRSYHYKDFLNQLSELNNRLSHYIFVWEQFKLDNTDKLIKNETKLTTEVYQANRFSNQYNVHLEHLTNSHELTSEFILKSLFILMHTEFEVFVRDLYEFARKANLKLPSLQVKERVPDKIFEHLGIDLSAYFDEKEILTFDYLRLRRNRIIHSGGQSKGDLAELIRQKGNSIQRYWEGRLTRGILELNFQAEEISQFSKEEIFDFINIWRLLCKKIDLVICAKIPVDDIIRNLAEEFKKEKLDHLRAWGQVRCKTKLKGYIMTRFNLEVTEDDLVNIVFYGEVA